MTAKEKTRELVNRVKNRELGFLIELCANTFAVEYQREAVIKTSLCCEDNHKKKKMDIKRGCIRICNQL